MGVCGVNVLGSVALRALDAFFRHEVAIACGLVLALALAVRLVVPAPRDVVARATGLDWLASPPPEPVADAPPDSVQRILHERAGWESAVMLGTMFALGAASLLGAEALVARTFRVTPAPRAAWGVRAAIGGLAAMYVLEPLVVEGYRRLSLATELVDYDPAHPTLPVQLGAALVAGLAACLVAAYASRGRAALGLVAPQPASGLFAVPFVLLCAHSFAIALACASVLVHTLLGVDVRAQGAAEVVAESRGWMLALVVVYLVIAAPLFEEVLFRGLVTGALERHCRPLTAAGLTAAVFALCHDASVMLPVFGTGYVLGLLRARTGGLVAPFAFHASYNALMVVLTVLAARAKSGG